MNLVKTALAGATARLQASKEGPALQAAQEHAADLANFRQGPLVQQVDGAIAKARVAASQELDSSLNALLAAQTQTVELGNRAAGFVAQHNSLIEVRDAIGRNAPAAVEAAQETLRKCTAAGDDAGAAAAAEKLASLERSAAEAQAKRRPIELRVEALRAQSASAVDQVSAAEESERAAEVRVKEARFGLVAIERDAAVWDATVMDAYLRSKTGFSYPGLSMSARGRPIYVVGESKQLLALLDRVALQPVEFEAFALDRLACGEQTGIPR